jgi:excinuclease ABC subunit C
MISSLSERLRQKLDSLPAKPGVYLFKDKKGPGRLYRQSAGAAQPGAFLLHRILRTGTIKTRRLVSRIDDLEIILTDSEIEALIPKPTWVSRISPTLQHQSQGTINPFPYIRITHEALSPDFPHPPVNP